MTADAHAAHHHEDFYVEGGKGIWSWLTTLDHKRIGLMYLWSVLLFFFVGGMLALTIRLELMNPGKDFLTAKQYNEVFTLHGAIMIFLFLIPAIPAALGNFVLPLLLGAKDVAFPRLNLASYYIYVLGGIFMIYAIWMGRVDTGWTFYTPYSVKASSAVIPMVLGVFIIGFSSIFTGLNFIATIHKMRTPGMTWSKMPLFCWGMYATSLIQVLATPVLGITLVLLTMEKVWHIGLFDPERGGDPVLFQHFFWFYSHPAVYIMILPGMAVISEVIPTFSQKHIFGYKAIGFSSVAIAILGFLVWGHHMFVATQSQLASIIFSAITYLIGIPSAIKVFNWLATMYKGSVQLKTPMLYALSFIFLFTIGGLTGIFLACLAVDIHLTDTYFVVAHFHYVMMGGNAIGFLAGLHYWWPKMFGRMYNEKLAQIACALVFIGFNGTFLPQFVMGSRGMPRRYYDYLPEFHTMHMLSTMGSWVLALGFFLMAGYLLASLRVGAKAADNPWLGLTLEWQTASPPPLHNFEKQPIPKVGPYDYGYPVHEPKRVPGLGGKEIVHGTGD
ncbi:MAG TPA: cytochrome c oxidase subunit I [Blastocatellia bacterium]|nr:cytochrome c oxidase subunit I [Blastocatellia bacterium]